MDSSFIKLPYSGDPILETVSIPEDTFLQSCYDIIGCEWIEIVHTVIPGVVMIIDEIGKLSDHWEQRVNVIASALYGSFIDPIVGNVIVAKQKGPDLVPLGPRSIAKLCVFIQGLSCFE